MRVALVRIATLDNTWYLLKRISGRMGNLTDPMAVVDSKAKVIGVNGLRVVDASSFALLPPGHPQSTVCKLCRVVAWFLELTIADLMAEKIAADILSG